MAEPVYRRLLLKLSGEALGEAGSGVSPKGMVRLVEEIGEVARLGVELGIVIGAGNLIRGAMLAESGIHPVTADQMGMLGTVINALALRDMLEAQGIAAEAFCAFPAGFCQTYDRRQAVAHLRAGKVVVFAGGTGNPFFTTDSAASLRAIEIGAELLLKATKVDGVYSADPLVHPDAQRFSRLTFEEALARDLKVMDATAMLLCRDHHLPLRVFSMHKPGAMKRIALGGEEGTLVENERRP
ncbi:MAG: UMP kinase [Gammaproteobacteria bacterium]|nr:MAG: UMP kinase [Gammaproteobacteria bacterium]